MKLLTAIPLLTAACCLVSQGCHAAAIASEDSCDPSAGPSTGAGADAKSSEGCTSSSAVSEEAGTKLEQTSSQNSFSVASANDSSLPDDCLSKRVSPMLKEALDRIAVHYDPKHMHHNFENWIRSQIRMGTSEDINLLLEDRAPGIQMGVAYDIPDRTSHLDFGFGRLGNCTEAGYFAEKYGFDDFFHTHGDDDDDQDGEDWEELGHRLLGPKGWGIQDQRLDQSDEADGPNFGADYAAAYTKLGQQFGLH